MSRLPLEREAVIQLVATATGKLGALGEQITSLKRRAIGVETRLEEALKGPTTAKRKAEKLPQQDLISPQVLFLHVCWLYPQSVWPCCMTLAMRGIPCSEFPMCRTS